MHCLEKIIKPFEGLIKKRIKDQNNNKLREGCYVYELEADSTIPSEYSGGRINTGSSSRRRRNSREEH